MPTLNAEIMKYLITLSRESSGSIAFFWLVMMSPVLANNPTSTFVWLNAGISLVYDITSTIYKKQPDIYYEENTGQARLIYILFANGYALYWGVLTAYILYFPEFQIVHFAAAFVLAIGTIGGFILWLLSRRAGQIYMASLFVPPAVVLFMQSSLSSTFSALFILFCMFLTLRLGDVRSRVFLESMINQMHLEEKADRYQEISHQDPLTKVFNRRHFDLQFPEVFEEAREHHFSLSLLVIDIDYFKRINDEYGHDAGDQCLKIAANHMKKEIRAHGDELCRYGGEEFVILLKDSDITTAASVAERICISFRNKPVTYSNSEIEMTVSVGVASLTKKEDTPEALFKVADHALYSAKMAGRDQYAIGDNALASSS